MVDGVGISLGLVRGGRWSDEVANTAFGEIMDLVRGGVYTCMAGGIWQMVDLLGWGISLCVCVCVCVEGRRWSYEVDNIAFGEIMNWRGRGGIYMSWGGLGTGTIYM